MINPATLLPSSESQLRVDILKGQATPYVKYRRLFNLFPDIQNKGPDTVLRLMYPAPFSLFLRGCKLTSFLAIHNNQ